MNNDVDHHIFSKKPAVPVKPSKLIYATPTLPKTPTTTTTCVVAPQAPPLPTVAGSDAVPIVVASPGRESILEMITMLETSLKVPVTTLTAVQWLQLSERLNALQSSCVGFAEKESMPPHTKFQFRELVTRVENQSRGLRLAGTKNVQDNEKLLQDVGQSLKQISNALNR